MTPVSSGSRKCRTINAAGDDEDDRHHQRVAENLLGVFDLLFAQRDRDQRAGADADQHADRHQQRHDRESDRHGGQRDHADALADEHAVDDVVAGARQHAGDRGQRELPQQPGDLFFF